jgi:hypothetical protein
VDSTGKFTTIEKGIPMTNYAKMNNLKSGQYVYGPHVRGIYFKGGVELDFADEEDLGMFDEWKDKLTRESMAKSSLIKLRKTHGGTYFTKGKLNDLGYFLKEQTDVNMVFINTILSPL